MGVIITDEQSAEWSALGQAVYQGIQEEFELPHDTQPGLGNAKLVWSEDTTTEDLLPED